MSGFVNNAWSNKARAARAMFGVDSPGTSPFNRVRRDRSPTRKVVVEPRAIRRMKERAAAKGRTVELETWDD